MTPIDKWAGLVFELFNLDTDKPVEQLCDNAVAGMFDREAYVTECTKLEYEAAKKARKFFEEHPLPDATSGNAPYYNQICNVSPTYEQYLVQFKDENGRHPGEFFMNYFDSSIAPYINTKVETKTQNETENAHPPTTK